MQVARTLVFIVFSIVFDRPGGARVTQSIALYCFPSLLIGPGVYEWPKVSSGPKYSFYYVSHHF